MREKGKRFRAFERPTWGRWLGVITVPLLLLLIYQGVEQISPPVYECQVRGLTELELRKSSLEYGNSNKEMFVRLVETSERMGGAIFHTTGGSMTNHLGADREGREYFGVESMSQPDKVAVRVSCERSRRSRFWTNLAYSPLHGVFTERISNGTDGLWARSAGELMIYYWR